MKGRGVSPSRPPRQTQPKSFNLNLRKSRTNNPTTAATAPTMADEPRILTDDETRWRRSNKHLQRLPRRSCHPCAPARRPDSPPTVPSAETTTARSPAPDTSSPTTSPQTNSDGFGPTSKPKQPRCSSSPWTGSSAASSPTLASPNSPGPSPSPGTNHEPAARRRQRQPVRRAGRRLPRHRTTNVERVEGPRRPRPPNLGRRGEGPRPRPAVEPLDRHERSGPGSRQRRRRPMVRHHPTDRLPDRRGVRHDPPVDGPALGIPE